MDCGSDLNQSDEVKLTWANPTPNTTLNWDKKKKFTLVFNLCWVSLSYFYLNRELYLNQSDNSNSLAQMQPPIRLIFS